MKTKDIKAKVSAKIGKAKAKIGKKCGKAAKCVLILFALALVCTGCATADAPTAQRAQNVTVTDNEFNFNFGVCGPCMTNGVCAIPSFQFEFGTAAQANETSGTETMTATATQTPTNDVKPTTTFTYGLSSAGSAGTDWISQLTSASAKGLSEWLKSGKDGELVVTKTDGSTECVTCKDGVCTPGTCSDCVYCEDCQK